MSPETHPKSGDLVWSTEQVNGSSIDLDTRSTEEIVATLVAADAVVPEAVAAVTDEIAAAADLIVACLTAGGIVRYIGSGTSGRMGVLDAVELWPTFHVGDDQFRAYLAGGPGAMMRAVEGAEDDQEAGAATLDEAGPHDLVVGLAASGRTPYVRGALTEARRRGLPTVLIAANPAAPLAELADVSILPDTGPEVITGSTRLKAATAQKMILNAMSSAAMVKAGKTYSNLMIDMIPSNAKLRARAVRILQLGAGVDDATAARALDEADGNMRLALVMLLAEVGPRRASAALEANPPDPHRQGDPSGLRTAVRSATQGAWA